MAGGAIRAAIVVGGLAVGAFVLANGNFAAGGQAIEAPSPSTTISPSPSTSSSPTAPKTTKPAPTGRSQGVKVAVFNTTEVVGLAACAADDLTQQGYVIPANAVLQAPTGSTTSPTLILYRGARGKADAQLLADKYFRGDAKVRPLKENTGVPKSVELAVYLGSRYANTHPGGC